MGWAGCRFDSQDGLSLLPSPKTSDPGFSGMEGLDLGRSGFVGNSGIAVDQLCGVHFRRPDSLRDLRAVPRRAVEPRSGRPCAYRTTEEKICCAMPGVPSPVLLVCLQSRFYFQAK